MLDEQGHRHFIHSEDVKGLFRRWRTRVYWVLILIFLSLPWVKINGHQAILLNLPERRFAFFGLTFWAHDGPIIFFLLLFLTMSLIYVTAIWGRVWCGWACPQTVFIDAIYRKIENLIDGNPIERRRLDAAPLSLKKVGKRLLKWGLFLLISLSITHSFLAYFVGAENLAQMVTSSPSENWVSFLITWVTGLIILLNFAWFREQFCLIVCPYGRLQSALMDDQSMAILYDENRGEPRRSKDTPPEKQGDCVACYRCVSVCPTGIDIRRGIQLECIACTACIDVCDEMMTRNKKPTGLIRYSNERAMQSSKPKKRRPMLILYLLLICLGATGLAINVYNREKIAISIIRALEAPYNIVKQDEGGRTLTNHFKIGLHNLDIDKSQILVVLDSQFKGQNIELITPINPVQLNPGETSRIHLFFKFHERFTENGGQKKIRVFFFNLKDQLTIPYSRWIKLVGPSK